MNYNEVQNFGQVYLERIDPYRPVAAAIKDAIDRRDLALIKRYVPNYLNGADNPFGYITFTVDRAGGSTDSCNPNVHQYGDFTIVTLQLWSNDGTLVMIAPGVSKRSIVDRIDDPDRAMYNAAFRAAKYVDDLLTFGWSGQEWSHR